MARCFVTRELPGDAVERLAREHEVEVWPERRPTPGVTVVPHIGSASERTRAAMADMAVDNLLAALAGERMPHPANPSVYGAAGG